MRWNVDGANAILGLRCCTQSDRYEDFWGPSISRNLSRSQISDVHPPHFGACSLVAVVALALAPGRGTAQSMASAERRAMPPLPLPEGVMAVDPASQLDPDGTMRR